MRQVVGSDLDHEPVPDETTICKFHHLLEAPPQLGAQLFALILAYSCAEGADSQPSHQSYSGKRDVICQHAPSAAKWIHTKAHHP